MQKVGNKDHLMIFEMIFHKSNLQYNFSGSNTDGSFTTAVSNSFLSLLEKILWLQIWDKLG